MPAALYMDAVITPNRSLPRVGFYWLIGILVASNLIMAAVFVAMGALPVPVFLGLDVLGVFIAFRVSYARGRLAIARADARRLPVRDESLPAVICVMAHTDMPGYPAVVREAARVLRPGGALVHVGVHPCFCGGFADRSDPQAVVIGPGYLDRHWTKASWTDRGVRDKVGATHFPLPVLLHAFTSAGLILDRFAEGGTPSPQVLAIRASKPAV